MGSTATHWTSSFDERERDVSVNVTIATMPSNMDEFRAMAQMDLTRPENTCAMFICALNLFVANKSVGVEAINILKGPVPLNAHEIHFISDRLRDKAYLPMVYFEGAKPENNYTPTSPYTLAFLPDPRPQDCESGFIRLYLKTAGADSPRFIKLRQKGQEWFLWDYPGFLMGVRKPAKEDPWA